MGHPQVQLGHLGTRVGSCLLSECAGLGHACAQGLRASGAEIADTACSRVVTHAAREGYRLRSLRRTLVPPRSNQLWGRGLVPGRPQCQPGSLPLPATGVASAPLNPSRFFRRHISGLPHKCPGYHRATRPFLISPSRTPRLSPAIEIQQLNPVSAPNASRAPSQQNGRKALGASAGAPTEPHHCPVVFPLTCPVVEGIGAYHQGAGCWDHLPPEPTTSHPAFLKEGHRTQNTFPELN